MQQSTFTSKLVSFFSQKLIMIADFEHSAKKWPVGEKLTKFLLIEALRAMFPTDVKRPGIGCPYNLSFPQQMQPAPPMDPKMLELLQQVRSLFVLV